MAYTHLLKRLQEEKKKKEAEVYVVEDEKGKSVNQDRVKTDRVMAPYKQQWQSRTTGIRPSLSSKEEDKGWISKILQRPEVFNNNLDVFKDGYQFGDLTKFQHETIKDVGLTIGGTVGDIGLGVVKGIANVGEGLGDLGTYGIAQIADWTGNDEYANRLRTNAAEDTINKLFEKPQSYVNKASVIGDTGDKVSEGIGYMASIWAATTVGGPAATSGLIFSNSTGTNMADTYEEYGTEGVTSGQAWGKSLGSAAIETVTEQLFGMFGKADTRVINAMTAKATSGIGKALTRAGGQAAGEGLEEIISYAGNHVWDRVVDAASKGEGAKFAHEWNWEDMWEQAGIAAITALTMSGGQTSASALNNKNSNNTWKDAINETARQQDIQAMEEEIDDLNAKLKKEGKYTVQGAAIQAQINEKQQQLNALETQGQIAPINANTQENGTLTQEQYMQELDALQREYLQAPDVHSQTVIQQQIDELQAQAEQQGLMQDTNAQQITNTQVQDETELKRQHFTYETNINDSDIKKAVYESASKYMNNTVRSHEFVDTVAKIAEDRGTRYEFINTEGLKEAGYNLENASINGLVTEDGRILVNIDSNQGLDFIIGHETTHLLEGTEEYQGLQDLVIEYAKQKGIYDERVTKLTNLYEGTNANIDAELTSDLVGELLFTDEAFVESLSVKQPNIFQKIYDYIKHVYKMATAGSKEARQLEKIKRQFDKAYKVQSNQTSNDTKYSFIGEEVVRGNKGAENALRLAKDMKAEHQNKELVRQTTGWFVGQEGKWRAEIDDSNSRITKKLEKNKSYRLGNIFKHDELYSFIPGYKNIEVQTRNMVSTTIGSFNKKKGVITLNNKYLNNTNEIRKTILHELQHATQKIEGYKGGTSLRRAGSIESYLNNPGEAEAREVESRADMTFDQRMAKAPKTQSRIQYSISEDGKMVDSTTNKEVKLEATETGTHGTLMAIHNLSDSKLKGIIELGGFPVPSIAITKPTLNFTNYGEISVIFDKETINPANKQNEVYGSDVYSPRFPQTVNELNEEGVKQVASILGMSDYMFESNYENMTIDDVVNRLTRKEHIIDKYLESKNITVDPIYKTYSAEQSGVSTKYVEGFLNTHEELQNNNINIRELDYDNYSREVRQIYIDSLVEQGVSIKEAQELYSNFGKADVTKFLIDVKNFKKASSQGQQIDTYATKRVKEEHIDFNSDEYRSFVKNLIAPAFGDKYIRNNKDLFTPSGNRRNFKQLHDAYNLENVVKNMKGKVRGEEGFFYGAGNIRSQVTPQFKSIAEIKANEGKLVTAKQMEEVKQDINSNLDNLSDIAKNFGGYSYDSYEAALNEIAELKKITYDKAKAIMNEYGFNDVPDILIQKSIEFLEKLKNAPTEYFEAKPQRAVGFEEVEAIIVPNNISPELKQQIYDKGLNVIEYDPTIEGDRQAKIDELDQYKFSLSSQNEEAPIGNVFGKDLKVQLEEAIAPLQETINNLTEQVQEQIEGLTEQVQTIQENIAPVEEQAQPTQPTLEEVQNLIDIRDNKSGSEYASAFFALRDKYGQAELYKSLNEYYSTGTVTQPSNTTEIDTAPASQEVVEQQNQEAFETITDNEAPIDVDNRNFEDTVDELMWDIESEATTENKVQSPLDNRDIDEVGNRKVKAYQYENPEVKPYFQTEAQNMLYDLDNTIKGERIATHDEEGYITGWAGITRQTTEAIAYLKDNYGYSYDQIRKGLNAIIEDDGKENNAVSKRIEFMLDERLREGYTTSDGIPIPANEDYINFLNEKQITQYNKEAFNALSDKDIPAEIAPIEETTQKNSSYEKIEPRELPVSPEITQSNETIPMKRITAENQNTDVTEGKVRKWAKTSTESEVLRDDIAFEDLNIEKVMYQPITNMGTLNKANDKLGTLGYNKAVEYFNSQIVNKKVSVEDIALGERLIQEAIKQGDKTTAAELIQNVAILGTELGQKVQALSIIQRMTPAGQLKMLDKTINRGKVKEDAAFKGIELTQEMKDKILSVYNEDGTYDQDELNRVIDEVKQEIADNMPVTKMEKINEWRYFSMLGNPKTHIRNLVSNVAMKGTVAVKNTVARTLETIAPIENRTKTWLPSSQEVKNFAKQTAVEMKDIISGGSKYSETADIKARRKIFKNKVLHSLTGGNSNILEKEDWWFSKGAFENSFKEFLTANGIKTQQDIQNNPELIEKGKLYATEQAQIATFRQYSWLANKIRDIESKNAATQIAVGAILPFKKTPINIAKTGLSYSPLGFVKTLTYDIAQVKKGNMEASTLIDHIAQNTTGTALTLVGYLLAQAGILNGAGDDDKEGKYDYQLGKQAYSLNIGGNTYSLSWLSPVAMPMFVGANAYEQLVEGEEWNADVVMETLGQTLDPLSEMSFLSSLDSVLSSYDSGVQRFFGIGEAMLQNYATQFVPTASSQLAATLDDTKRTTKVAGNSDSKVIDELYNSIIYKIPGLRETLEPTTDIWGNEVKQSENLLQRAFENFISPYARKESIATEIDEELKDLYSQTGDNGILPNIPYNYVNYDGEKYRMSAEEYTDFKKTYGQTANDLLEDLFRTTTYRNADSEERTDMVNKVYDYASDLAKKEYLSGEGVSYTNATKDGKEVYKENLIKGAIENDMSVEEYGLYVEDPEEYSFLMEKDYLYRRKYFDTSESLKEIEETFSDQKDGIDDEDELDVLSSEKKASIVEKIVNSGLDDTEKASLYKKYYNTDTVDTIMKSAISIDDYLTYETKEFKADKNEKGNSIPGSRKDKVIDYVNTLDMDIPQKAILIKSTNTFKFNDYNEVIIDYVDSLGIEYEEKVKILKDLDFEVDSEGNIYWD